MLQSCFVAFFNDTHNAKRVFDFINNMRASAEVHCLSILFAAFALLLTWPVVEFSAVHFSPPPQLSSLPRDAMHPRY